MEAEELQMGTVHHGHNIRRTRRLKGVKQLALADTMEMSQQTISRYESMPEIDEMMLQKFAKALNVPVETLKAAEENASMVVFENNTVTNNNEGGASSSTLSHYEGNDVNDVNDNRTTILNPIEKIIELYERLLEEEKGKFAALEQRLQAVEKKLDK